MWPVSISSSPSAFKQIPVLSPGSALLLLEPWGSCCVCGLLSLWIAHCPVSSDGSCWLFLVPLALPAMWTGGPVLERGHSKIHSDCAHLRDVPSVGVSFLALFELMRATQIYPVCISCLLLLCVIPATSALVYEPGDSLLPSPAPLEGALHLQPCPHFFHLTRVFRPW